MSWKELPQSTHKIVIMFEIEEDIIKKLFFFLLVLARLKIMLYFCSNKSRPLPVRLAYPAGHFFYLWESDIRIKP